MEEMRGRSIWKIAGVVGAIEQAAREAQAACLLGYDAVLLSLGALVDASIPELLAHARAIADIVPVVGFYLQPSVGGRILPYEFWRGFAGIPNVVGIKIAPFNRYQTLDVVRAVAESGRDIPLLTGNDDNIVLDLLTPFRFANRELRIGGGLLGHWAVWTRCAVELTTEIAQTRAAGTEWLARAVEVTDANAAFFDVANQFHGCIAGLHEVLRRQGLMAGRWCLDSNEELSPGQMEEIDRVYRTYPHLNDDAFVSEHLDQWLK